MNDSSRAYASFREDPSVKFCRANRPFPLPCRTSRLSTWQTPKAFLDRRIWSSAELTEALGVLQNREDNPVLSGELWIQKFWQIEGRNSARYSWKVGSTCLAQGKNPGERRFQELKRSRREVSRVLQE